MATPEHTFGPLVNETFIARLFGGPADGKTFAIQQEHLLHGLRFDEAPLLHTDQFWPRVHLYVWDGTVNEAGERRMRWTGEPRA